MPKMNTSVIVGASVCADTLDFTTLTYKIRDRRIAPEHALIMKK